jgi:RHS repeat-associated protein
MTTDTYDYDAFGNKINSTGTTPNSYLYRGEAFDSDLSLYYLRARWMSPLTGPVHEPGSGRWQDHCSGVLAQISLRRCGTGQLD